jgi:hypothetical protein
MLPRLRQSGDRVVSRKRRKVGGAPEVQCPFRVNAREQGLNYPEDHCKDGQTFKGNEKLKFVTPMPDLAPPSPSLTAGL